MRDLHVKTRIKPANNANRVKRERKPINWRPLVTWGSRIVCGALLVTVAGILCYEGYRCASRVRINVLQLETIEVSKLKHLTRDEVIAESGVKAGDSMVGLRLRRIGEQLAKNPWIEKVQVRRYFPHTLAFEVTEREPVAVVNMGFLYYLDAKGEVFKPLTHGDSLNYPVITGVTEDDLARDPEGTRKSLTASVALMGLLQKSQAFSLADVSEIHIDKGFGFTLFTAAGGVPVRLGNDGFDVKLSRLAHIYGELRGNLTALQYIDLDYHDKIIVKKG
ncbi:cell division protein FtsQ/DivIB [Geobacter pickeringii]|uniref:Cell division protein FtsQ n=1 Tax=Geobacter pickeringii TaxID=345632 RepID=A0A0B5B762_9BACT|nr:FtsQ-type POTRA domain-containing protein [Geobacter pickeringii]AJE02377.1 cell division protein FtsQ [Geobacter pickeringii]